MLNILSITGPIYLSIGVGYVATRQGFFSKTDGQVLGRFVLNFGLPAMLFNALAQRQFSDILHPGYLVAYGVGSFLALSAGFAIWHWGRGKGRSESALVAMGFCSSNSGYVGYPILLQILGPAAGVGLALSMLIENLFIIPLSLAIADSGEATHDSWLHMVWASLKNMLKLPMIWSILAGFLCSLLGVQLPDVVSKTINLFAASCAGAALFVNGGSLVGMRFWGALSEVSWVAFGKLVLHPLCVGAMLWAVGPMEAGLQISAVVLAAMPMLGIYPLLAQRHGHQTLCAAALLVTTVMSFFSISLILWGMSQVPGWHI
jgi:malonate transporter